jgi:hypothetical protein
MSIDKLALDSIALAAMVRAALHFGPRGDYLEVIEPSARSVFRAAGVANPAVRVCGHAAVRSSSTTERAVTACWSSVSGADTMAGAVLSHLHKSSARTKVRRPRLRATKSPAAMAA